MARLLSSGKRAGGKCFELLLMVVSGMVTPRLPLPFTEHLQLHPKPPLTTCRCSRPVDCKVIRASRMPAGADGSSRHSTFVHFHRLMDSNGRRIQPVDATDSLNISAGVWKPSVLRGLSFNCLAIALS